MSISEQVKELRTIANNLSIGHNMPISLAIERFRKAADTIESLSAKLQAANIKQSAEDCGGWITCKNKPHRKRDESSRPVLVRYKDETARPDVCNYNFLTDKFIFIERDVTEFVKEWREIPGYEP